MSNSLFRRKSIDKIVHDVDLPADDIHSHGLKRVLTVKDLTFFGIAAIIGAGSFSSLGGAVFNGGPGVVILFVITGIACAFTAFVIQNLQAGSLWLEALIPMPMQVLGNYLPG